jgi:hypothetical protein
MDLLARLRDDEDRLVERKPATAGKSDFKRTIVAFANSVPENRVGVLFVGIGDDGIPHGVPNPDRMQRDLRQLGENDCYPPIFVDSELVRIEDKVIVAVLVGPSNQRPHFAGPAFVRRGSESVNASAVEYEQLLQSQVSIVRRLQPWAGKLVTVTEIAKQLGEYFPIGDSHQQSDTYELVEINPHFVRFKRIPSGAFVTEIIDSLRLSWDELHSRPRILAFPMRRAAS